MELSVSKAVRHSAFSLGAQVFNAFVSLFQTAYLARHLRVAKYSEYSLVFSFAILFLTFTDFGISQIAVREVARFPDRIRPVLSAIFSVRLLLALAGWLGCIFAAAWSGYSSTVTAGIWIYSLVLLVSPLNTVSVINQIRFRGDLALLAGIGGRVLLLAGTVAGVRAGMGLNALFAVAVGASTAEYVLNAFLIGGWGYLKPCWDVAMGKFLALEALPLGLGSLLATVINRFDVILLSKLSGMEAVGIYSAPFRVVYFLNFIPQAVVASFYPLVSEYRQAQPDRVQEIYQRTVELLTFLALPMAVGGTVLAPQIIPLIFGETFKASVPVFEILIWQVAIVFVATVPGTVLTAYGFQRLGPPVQVAAAMISLACNVLFIPFWGPRAAAVASLLAHSFQSVATFFLVRQRLEFRIHWTHLAYYGACGVLMGLVAHFVASYNALISVLAAGSFYLFLVGMLRKTRRSLVRDRKVSC